MADEKTTFKLDLDSSDFTAGLKDATSKLGLFGSADNLKGLISGFDSLLPMLGVLGTAFAVLKGSFDAVFEAERINAVNQQFDTLTQNAGIATDELREGLAKSADGLIDTTDLLGVANKAIVAMGSSAVRLPEVLDLARKAAVLTGGDAKAAFEGITQAVSTGNLRVLKHMGIVVDANKAYQDFAKANGVAVESLSATGKQQALLNEVLTKGNQSMQGIDTSVLQTTNAFAQLKTTFTEIKEVFLLVFDKTIGPYLTSFLQFVSSNLKSLKDTLLITFGDPKQKVEGLQESLTTLRAELTRLQSGDLSWWEKLSPKTVQSNIQKTTTAIAAQEAALKKLHIEQDSRKPAGGGATPNSDAAIIDIQKQLQAEAKFEKDLVAIRKDRTAAYAKIAQSEAELNFIYSSEKINLEKETEAKIAQIDASTALSSQQKAAEKVELEKVVNAQLLAADFDRANKMSEFRQKRQEELLAMATTEKQVQDIIDREKDIAQEQALQKTTLINQSEILDENQKAQQIEFINNQLAQNLANLDNRIYDAKKSALDNEVNVSNTAAQKILLGFQNTARKGAIEMTNFNKVGANTANKFADNFTAAFTKVGQGQETIAQAMLDSFSQTVGQMAIEYGRLVVLKGIADLDPLEIAGGAALIAFGGALSGASGSSSAAAGGSAAATTTANPTPQTAPDAQAAQVPQKSVTVQIMGHYFNTQQTATMLTDIVRQASDATNFTVQQVGGGF